MSLSEPVPVAELSYGEADAELEAIVERLEHDQPDVDRVTADVARAAELVKHCRARITSARLSVEEVVSELTTELSTDPTD